MGAHLTCLFVNPLYVSAIWALKSVKNVFNEEKKGTEGNVVDI